MHPKGLVHLRIYQLGRYFYRFRVQCILLVAGGGQTGERPRVHA